MFLIRKYSIIKSQNFKFLRKLILMGVCTTLSSYGLAGVRRSIDLKKEKFSEQQPINPRQSRGRRRGHKIQHTKEKEKNNNRWVFKIVPVLTVLILYYVSFSGSGGDDDSDDPATFSGIPSNPLGNLGGFQSAHEQEVPIFEERVNSLSSSVLKAEIEHDLNDLGKPYTASLENYANAIHDPLRLKVEHVVSVDHTKKIAAFRKVLELDYKVEKYFASETDGLSLPNGLSKEMIKKKIAPYGIQVLKYIDTKSPYYEKTKALYEAYAPVPSKPQFFSRKTEYHFGHNIDNVVEEIVLSSKDIHLKRLHYQIYDTSQDLTLEGNLYLFDTGFRDKLLQEIKPFSNKKPNKYVGKLDEILKRARKSGSASAKAFMKAYNQRLIAKDHFFSFILYTDDLSFSGSYVAAQTYKHAKVKTELKKQIYFHVVYKDLLKRIVCINNDPSLDFKFPDFKILVEESKHKHKKLRVYRGLKAKNLYFPDFSGDAPYAMSTTTSPHVAKNFSKDCYILGLSPYYKKNCLDIKFCSTFDTEKELLITGGKLCIDEIYVQKK